MFFFVANLCYSIGVKIYWSESMSNLSLEQTIKRELEELNNDKLPSITKTINENYNKLKKMDSTRCYKCEKYGASWGLITCGLMKYDSHKSFIGDLVNSKAVQKDQIKRIKEDFAKAKYAKLLCILSNPQYFDTKDENKLKSLTDYFISFYPVLKSKQSRIKRIFSFSTVKVSGSQTVDKQKSQWLLQYLIINLVTGVETYLLFDEEELTCVHIDYVIGKFDRDNQIERVLYVSYEPDGIGKTTNKDLAICSDYLLTNIVDKDFYDRLYGKMSNGDVRNNLELTKDDNENLKKTVKELGLSESDVSNVLSNLIIHINNCKQDGVTKEMKRELVNEVNSIKVKIVNNSNKE